MTTWLLRLFGEKPNSRQVVPRADKDESYARMLLTGDAAPPTDYMRNKKLDEALDGYRETLRQGQTKVH
jgi:hypothetical protein